MHLYFAARAGKASLVSACKRMMKAAENAGFTCSLLSDGIVNDSADASVIIAVGGDGNLIRTAHVACREDLPLFGVNCGRIGFLTEWTEDRFPEALQKLAKGDFTIETRSMLTVSVNGERMRDCFNDLLVYKHSFSGVAKISLSLNGQEMGDLFGDGAVRGRSDPCGRDRCDGHHADLRAYAAFPAGRLLDLFRDRDRDGGPRSSGRGRR